MHPTVARVAQVLEAAGWQGEVRELSDSARTAAEAATALGCEVGAIASSLVFRADDQPLLVVTSGAHRVDTSRVEALLGVGEVGKAPAALVREATGFAIGGVPPLGHPAPLRTIVDVELERHEVVWAAASHPHAVFSTTFEELVRLTGGTPAQVGE